MPSDPAFPRVVAPPQREHVAVVLDDNRLVPAIRRRILGNNHVAGRDLVPVFGRSPPQCSGVLTVTDAVLARVAALKTASTPDLRGLWRQLFETEPPAYNRRFLESRLAYRIQELAFGGLKPETLKRLKALAEDLDGGDPARRRRLAGANRPISGTRLIREWQGVEHCVTVLPEGFEYQGRPFQSLSAVAREITGTRWNGWVFFGLKNQRARS
jgi:hypothetical protein